MPFRNLFQYPVKTEPVLVPAAVVTAIALFSQVSVNIQYESRTQYQAYTAPTFVPPPEVLTVDKWIYGWSEPVRVKIDPRRAVSLAAPYTAFPIPIVERITVDKWFKPFNEPVREGAFEVISDVKTFGILSGYEYTYHQPWSEPRRFKLGLRESLQQFIAQVVLSDRQLTDTYESRWHQPWSEPVRFRRFPTSEQQAVAFVAPLIEQTTPDKWIYPWSEPVRQKIGFKAYLQQTLIAPVLEPETEIIQTYESRWHYPWSEPVRIKRQVPAGEQQSQIQGPVQTPEFITVDKWIYPWTDPVRQKIGIKTSLQQALIAPVLTDDQITGTIEARWHYPWSEPVRFKRFPTAEQQSQVQGPPQTPEFITVDKWVYGWSEPVRQKIWLKTHLQQAYIAPVLNPDTQISQDFESRWHFPWSEPVRVKRPFLTAQQQAAIFQSSFFETINIDKWGFAWSEPVRQKPGIKTYLQQAFIGLTLEPETQIIQTYESRWHQAWSEPVKVKLALRTGLQQTQVQGPVQTPEFITVDKWIYPWTDPVRQKIGIRASLQQAFIAPVLADEQITGSIESRWHQPWSEPVRFRRLATAEQPFVAAPTTSVFEIVTVDKWVYPWSEPVRQKIGLRASLQQAFIGLTLEPNTQIIQTFESRWHQPWSTPTSRPKFQVSEQQALVFQFVPTGEVVTLDKWVYPWTEPVRHRRGIDTAQQRAHFYSEQLIPPYTIGETAAISSPVIFKTWFIYQSLHDPVSELTSYDKWGFSWSEPVRVRRFPTSEQQALAFTVLERISADKWIFPWSEPVRFRRFPTAQQQFTTPATPIYPTGVVKLIQWFAPLNEPVRLKIGMAANLQRWFTAGTDPIVNPFQITLSATEINADSAFFGITAYNAVPVVTRVPAVVVSIKEIPSVGKAAVSLEENKAIDAAAVSIEET